MSVDTAAFVSYKNRILESCRKVILGKEEAIEKLIIAYLCGGHILLEDLPGTGKTMLLRAFSACTGTNFKRIQFTPDLMPSDLTGIHFFNQKESDFTFRPGPLFGDLILADEINRATPRTQSSLLEAMEEHQITIDGKTYPLSDLYTVAATQNPIESYGTFPLPQAQMDRFFMRLTLGYMNRADEIAVLRRASAVSILQELEPVVTREETLTLRSALKDIRVCDAVTDYLMDLITETRSNSAFSAGISTRGALCLYHASQAQAAISGRDYVLPEDVKNLAIPILAHRVDGSTDQTQAQIERILQKIPVPTEVL